MKQNQATDPGRDFGLAEKKNFFGLKMPNWESTGRERTREIPDTHIHIHSFSLSHPPILTPPKEKLSL